MFDVGLIFFQIFLIAVSIIITYFIIKVAVKNAIIEAYGIISKQNREAVKKPDESGFGEVVVDNNQV